MFKLGAVTTHVLGLGSAKFSTSCMSGSDIEQASTEVHGSPERPCNNGLFSPELNPNPLSSFYTSHTNTFLPSTTSLLVFPL